MRPLCPLPWSSLIHSVNIPWEDRLLGVPLDISRALWGCLWGVFSISQPWGAPLCFTFCVCKMGAILDLPPRGVLSS